MKSSNDIHTSNPKRTCFWLMVFFMAFAVPSFAQNVVYPVPKRAPKFGTSSRDFGPRPGSRASDNAPDKTFRRVYSTPATLRLFVRAKCGERIGRKELIDKAKNSTLENGPVVQIDWTDDIRDQNVEFWLVTYQKREVVQLNLTAQGGKYTVKSKNETKRESWDVEKVIFTTPHRTCSKQEDLDERKVRIAVINALQAITLRHFRSNPSE